MIMVEIVHLDEFHDASRVPCPMAITAVSTATPAATPSIIRNVPACGQERGQNITGHAHAIGSFGLLPVVDVALNRMLSPSLKPSAISAHGPSASRCGSGVFRLLSRSDMHHRFGRHLADRARRIESTLRVSNWMRTLASSRDARDRGLFVDRDGHDILDDVSWGALDRSPRRCGKILGREGIDVEPHALSELGPCDVHLVDERVHLKTVEIAIHDECRRVQSRGEPFRLPEWSPNR